MTNDDEWIRAAFGTQVRTPGLTQVASTAIRSYWHKPVKYERAEQGNTTDGDEKIK